MNYKWGDLLVLIIGKTLAIPAWDRAEIMTMTQMGLPCGL